MHLVRLRRIELETLDIQIHPSRLRLMRIEVHDGEYDVARGGIHFQVRDQLVVVHLAKMQRGIGLQRAIFPANAPAKRTLLQKLTGSLVFDSFQQPALAGARSGTPGMRHALYEAGDYSVDIRLEEERGSTRVNMVGQLALRSQATDSFDGVPIMLLSGRKVVAEAVSNEFGEFQLSYEPNPRLKLHVPIQKKKERIELQLGSLVPKPRKRSGRKI